MTREETAEYLAKKVSGVCFLRHLETDSKYSELDESVLNLYKEWYEFSYWCDISGFVPLTYVDEANYSQSYEIERMLIFELTGGRYATVIESGCSCYDPSWATVDLHGDLQSALDSFQQYKREHE